MLKSMTGYGRGECQTGQYNFTVEMRSLNHRFYEVVIRMPRSFSILEDKIRKSVQGKLSRGRIEIFVTMEELTEKERNIKIDQGLALSYYNKLQELKFLVPLEGEITLDLVAKFPEVIKLEEEATDLEKIWSDLSKALEQALNNLKESRAGEGARLEQDIIYRLEKIKELVLKVESRAPVVVENYRTKLKERLQELLAAADETRLAMEVALLADRSNITEELVRLNGHLEQFKLLLKSEEAVGRHLDFLTQEIHRETNTVGSKANDYSIAHTVIAIKSEIEKIREQIQNIE